MTAANRHLALPLLALPLLLACFACEDEPQPDPTTPTPQAVTTRPAISGGTLAVAADGSRAVAADPARDTVYVVDLRERYVQHRVEAPGGPGRVVLSADAAYVALRRGSAVLAIDLDSGAARHVDTCAAPRGLALDGASLHVACADGTLDTLTTESGARVRRVHLDTDLRDVVVADGALHVTRFRSAEVLTLDRDGQVVRRARPEVGPEASPVVAWRTVALPNGELAMLHQRASLGIVSTSQEGGYGARHHGCGSGVVGAQVTVFDRAGAPRTHMQIAAALAVDIAPHPREDRVGIAVPSAPAGDEQNRVSMADIVDGAGRCVFPGFDANQADALLGHQVTAVARDGDGTLYAQSRQPAAVLDSTGAPLVALAESSVADRGHDLFHRDAGRGMACASCHPEAGDDGHVWLFAGHGLRRTQHLAGGLKGTAPFHWAGDMADFSALMTEVRQRRMGGEAPTREDATALLDWLDGQPLPPAPELDAGAVARGRDAFESSGCAGCHAGPLLTDNVAHDVGTGRHLQTPPLRGLAFRTGFMHDGCATELTDRFDPTCGGEAHGATTHLSSADLGDLVEYLRSL